jgi:hypothetical protein
MVSIDGGVERFVPVVIVVERGILQLHGLFQILAPYN